MSTWVWILIVVVVVAVALVVGAWLLRARRRSEGLRRRFGPEYDRVAGESEDAGAAEAELQRRAQLRKQLEIVQLSPESRDRYAEEWQKVQTRFVDEPSAAVTAADDLLEQVMRERGYPLDEFDQRAADISVDHPELVENYRAAHRTSLANEEDGASTEELRQAFVHYRSLFDELLETARSSTEEVR